VRFVRFEAPPVLVAWGALTPWGRGPRAWSEAEPRGSEAAEDVERLAGLPELAARRLDRFGLLAVAASRMALPPAAGLPEGCGILLGSLHGCEASNRAYGRDLETLPARELRPALFVRTVSGAAAADVSMALGLRGPSQTFVSGAVAGAEALVAAALILGARAAPACLAGAVEAPSAGDPPLFEAAAVVHLAPAGGDDTARRAPRAPSPLRLAGAALGHDAEGAETAAVLADEAPDIDDLIAVANPVPPEVLARWRAASGRARVLVMGRHGDLGAAGAVVAAILADAGETRRAFVAARDRSGETGLLRFER
jgi:hypothetical protein